MTLTQVLKALFICVLARSLIQYEFFKFIHFPSVL